ncbi:MAG: L-threonylcarbamoyladenylate synthase [Hyphomonas sp.]
MTAKIVNLSEETLQLAVDILRKGGLVAMPTETVYGLACDASNAEAVAKLYAAKGRPQFNPLIAHISSPEMAKREALFSPVAGATASQFWPGPLTLVLQTTDTPTVCDLARSGLDTIAVRHPAHPVAQALIEAFGGPLVAPSANRSGHISPTRAEHVQSDLGEEIDLILDGGPCERGLESTIVSFVSEPALLLRAGSIETQSLANFLEGKLHRRDESGAINAPGQMKSHYAPNATLRLNADAPAEGEAWLGFGPSEHAGLNLSPDGDLIEAASKLFAMLRALDQRFDRIAVSPIPNTGLGEAINDRLERAAHRD